ncbi:MAG: hypothetical protein HC865_13950 [Cyanobacteria bacterium RU_5_0]|nr:hypothetical protein [Cyanobacteria bacterium RU_5_0]
MLAGSRRRSPTVADSSLPLDRLHSHRLPRSLPQRVATADRFTPATTDRFTDCGNQPIASPTATPDRYKRRLGSGRSPAITSARPCAEPANDQVEPPQRTEGSLT